MNRRTKHTRLFRAVYNRLQLSNVLCGVHVRVSNVAAAWTTKALASPVTETLANGHAFVGQDAAIASDGSEKPERTLSFLVNLVGVDDFADATHKHLGGKARAFLQGVINQMMCLELIEDFLFPNNFGTSIRVQQVS